jgi:hypothetical protein
VRKHPDALLETSVEDPSSTLRKSVLPTSKRRLAAAAFAIIVLAVGVVRAPSWDSSSTGERAHVTASALHQRAAQSLHVDGVLPSATAALFGVVWATARGSRRRSPIPAATRLVRGRGPPLDLAY